MHSIEVYNQNDRALLLQLARQTIARGVNGKEPERPAEYQIPASLEQPRACFVTLKIDGRLRGCVGNLEANASLVDAVIHNSYLAAFHDQRFSPIEAEELERLEYEISVLTPMVPLSVTSEADLLTKIRPGIDGLLFEADGHRSTFLPSVWEQLAEPEQFLSQLRLKAGLAADYWSRDVKCWIYQAIKIGAGESD